MVMGRNVECSWSTVAVAVSIIQSIAVGVRLVGYRRAEPKSLDEKNARVLRGNALYTLMRMFGIFLGILFAGILCYSLIHDIDSTGFKLLCVSWTPCLFVSIGYSYVLAASFLLQRLQLRHLIIASPQYFINSFTPSAYPHSHLLQSFRVIHRHLWLAVSYNPTISPHILLLGFRDATNMYRGERG